MACEWAVRWISLDLDAEISELERAALARHLERCDGCRAASVEIRGFTTLLREATLTEPATPPVVSSPAGTRYGVTRQRAAVAVAAAVAVVAGLMSFPGFMTTAVSSHALLNAKEQRQLAREHVRIEPTLFLAADAPPPLSFAARALR